jgi:hypothetical protein
VTGFTGAQPLGAWQGSEKVADELVAGQPGTCRHRRKSRGRRPSNPPLLLVQGSEEPGWLAIPLFDRFGNPADSRSPVALRPLLAKGLPLTSVTSASTDTDTMKAESSQIKQFKGAVRLRVFCRPVNHVLDAPPELAPRWFGRPSSE